MLDISAIRRQFPILSREVQGHPLVYVDSAATAQKPQTVLDAMTEFYKAHNANAHRGMHVLSEEATNAYEGARKTVQIFIGARRPEEIVFTKSATESINLVARSWGDANLKKGDSIVLTKLEHHSNIIPWMQLCKRTGAVIRWMDIDDTGNLKLETLQDFLKDGTVKMVAVTAQSNVLGVRPDLKKIIQMTHDAGALILVDAAQAVAHHKTDVLALGCDFLAFSAHKLYGPTGIGVLYGRLELLQKMEPMLGGGGMIEEVTEDSFTISDIPTRFEAGSPAVAEAVGLKAAIDWISQFSWKEIEAHEQSLLEETVEVLHKIDSVHILGPADAAQISGCISFVIHSVHPHDLTDVLGKQGVCLRAGHHCAQPLHARLGITASSRISLGLYNTVQEIQWAAHCLRTAITGLGA
jgi:cysteine desulfurase/selenocysteine lyase